MPSLHGALEAVASRRLESPALAWRGVSWTYADLRKAVALVQSALRRRNLENGSRVAILLRNSPQYAAVYYGVLSAGCVAVPLNVQERSSVLAAQIHDSAAALLVGDRSHPEWPRLSMSVPPQVQVAAVALNDGSESLASLAQSLDAPAADEGGSRDHRPTVDTDLASIIYTSGTTGRPKGVMLSHGNLCGNAAAIIRSLELTERDHSLCVLPFHFSYGNSVLHSHLLGGARLTIEDNVAFPNLVLQRMQDARVSGFAGVPSTFALLLARQRLADFDFHELRYVTQAGGPMPRPLLARLRSQLPHARVYVMYGQTEATARITCLPFEDLDRKPGSVGLPIDGVDVEIRVDGRPAPPGTVGEIFVRGPNVMLGYWRNESETAEVLRDGWLCTRDLGYLDEEGYLYIAGRSSEMIKIGAFRVGPQEIEEVILGIEGIAEAAVVGIPDEVLGQVARAVVALRPGAEVTDMAIKAHCRAHLASYKVPKAVQFVASLPKTASGKIQRYKLLEDTR